MAGESFGRRLRILMAARGVKTAELAKSVGISRQMVNAYLSGESEPMLPTACKIASALGVSVDEMAVRPLGEAIDKE